MSGKVRLEVWATGSLHPSLQAEPFVPHASQQVLRSWCLSTWLASGEMGSPGEGRAGQERGHHYSSHRKDPEPQPGWRRLPGPATGRVMRFVCTSVVGSILTPLR